MAELKIGDRVSMRTFLGGKVHGEVRETAGPGPEDKVLVAWDALDRSDWWGWLRGVVMLERPQEGTASWHDPKLLRKEEAKP